MTDFLLLRRVRRVFSLAHEVAFWLKSVKPLTMLVAVLLTVPMAAFGLSARPDSLSRDSNAPGSFPSGHTATAFMGAELIRREYGNAWGAGAYLLAGGIGFLRIYNDRHWLGDVLAGAGFGILAANIAYWLLPLERKLFGWDKRKRKTTALQLLPSYQSATKAPMLTLSLTY